MGRAKNHHYVPKFYLRYFSRNGKSIHLLNKSRNRIIEDASIRGQCAIDNFHGWNERAESGLCQIESICAAEIKKLISTSVLPKRDTESFEAILTFVGLQHCRTLAQAEANDIMTDKLAKIMLEGRPEAEGIDLDQFRIGDEFPIAIPLSVGLRAIDMLNDLTINLLLAPKRMRFLTSDNPVVMYNSARCDVFSEGTIGLDCEGLQVFLPLNPHMCLYLFDSFAYRPASDLITKHIKLIDITKINILSILNSKYNIYARNVEDLEFARTLRKSTDHLESYDRVLFMESEQVPREDGTTSSIIGQFNIHPPASFSFDFAKLRRTNLDSHSRSSRESAFFRKKPANDLQAISYPISEEAALRPREQVSDATAKKIVNQYERAQRESRTAQDA